MIHYFSFLIWRKSKFRITFRHFPTFPDTFLDIFPTSSQFENFYFTLMFLLRPIGSDDESASAKKKTVGVEQGKCAQCVDSASYSQRNSLNQRLRSKCKVCGDFVCTTYEGHCYFTCGRLANASGQMY